MNLTLRYAAHSDRGLIRDGNQDSVYAGPRLLAVADGMGGMAAGDVASNIVVGTIAPLDDDPPGADLIDALRDSVASANQQLRDAVEANPQLEGMGTTLTAMLFSGTKFGLVHVGDSRAYLLRDGELTQITKDDTYVQMLVDEGRITLDEASSHPQRSLLTRALDGRDVDPEFSVREGRTGDRYLICSDGLSGVVTHETIAQALIENVEPGACVERLIQLALRAGAPDNVTVIIADVTDQDIVEDQPVVGGAAARDRGLTTVADAASPAGRAALAAQSAARAAKGEGEEAPQIAESTPPEEPPPVEPTSDVAEPKNRRIKVVALSAIAAVFFVAVGLLGWSYTQSQYYVGTTDDGYVALYRGVPGKVLGVRLSHIEARSGTQLTELTPVARNKVRAGIPADDLPQAHERLREITKDPNLLPPCKALAPLPSSSPPVSATPSPAPSPTPPASPRPSGSPTPSPSTAPSLTPTPSPTPSATDNPEIPGQNCRATG